VNPLDIVAILLLVVAALAGFRSGALPQIGGLAGAILAAIVGLTLLPSLQEPLAGIDPLPRAIVVVAGLLVAIAIGEGIGSTIGGAVAERLGDGVFGALDDVAGAGVGLLQGLLVVWLVGGRSRSGCSAAGDLAQTWSSCVRSAHSRRRRRSPGTWPTCSTTRACPTCSSASSRCRRCRSGRPIPGRRDRELGRRAPW
jgi:hypothetical protein